MVIPPSSLLTIVPSLVVKPIPLILIPKRWHCREGMVRRKYPEADVTVIESDSVAFLESFNEPIDILYLDSDNDAKLILNEAKAALGSLHEESIILIDDCFCEERKKTHGIQKGDLVIPFLEENGWIMEVKEYQALFVHEDRF